MKKLIFAVIVSIAATMSPFMETTSPLKMSKSLNKIWKKLKIIIDFILKPCNNNLTCQLRQYMGE